MTALSIAAVSFAAPAVTVVGLKSIAADLGGERSVPALAYSLAWLGSSFGGIPMGRAAERFGIRFTVIFGSAMIAVGWLSRKAAADSACLSGTAYSSVCPAIPASTLRCTFMSRAGSIGAAALPWP
jgi:MFS family permease